MAMYANRNWTEIKAAALAMYKAGVKMAEICKALNISHSSVTRWVAEAGIDVQMPKMQAATRARWERARLRKAADQRHQIEAEDEPVDLLGDLIEYGDDAEDLKQPVVEDDDWGREMLKTLKAIADALGVAV